MSDKFDALAKGLAQSVTRRSAVKKFGVGIAAIALTALGLFDRAGMNRKGCLPSGAFCRRAPSGANRCCSGVCVGDGDSATRNGYCV